MGETLGNKPGIRYLRPTVLTAPRNGYTKSAKYNGSIEPEPYRGHSKNRQP